MALNAENLGQEVKTAFDGLEGEDAYTPLKVQQAQASAIVTHFQTNAEINSSVQESTLSSSQFISSEQETVVSFTGDNFSSGVYSVPVIGTFSLQARVTFSDLTASCTEIYAALKKNSTIIDFDRCPLIDNATLTLSKVIDLTDTDTLSIIIYQSHGVTSHEIDSNVGKTYFTISKIGNKIL